MLSNGGDAVSQREHNKRYYAEHRDYLLMLDLFAGLGGASRAMKERGWKVITVDNDPDCHPDVLADITDYHYTGPKPDLVWASPPCTDFSRLSLPPTWKCNLGKPAEPDMTLVLAAKRIIEEINPQYWIVENVRGAVPYFKDHFGPPAKISGSRYLWGVFPICDPAPKYGKWRLPPTADRAALRSVIPMSISLAVCRAIEQELNGKRISMSKEFAEEPDRPINSL